MRGVYQAQRRRVYVPPVRSVTLPWLHPRQREVIDDPHRFKVLACGRRWGKTKGGAALCVSKAMDREAPRRVWWVAPSYGVAAIGWREIAHLASQIPGVRFRVVDRLIEFPTGGVIQIRSAAGQTGLRGEGLDLLVIDECAFIPEKAWTEALRPALSDRKGSAVLISTPKGRNWFWKLWLRGQEGEEEWKSWKLPTVSNPIIDPAEVEEAKRTLPDRSFTQEYLAEFLEDAGEVFRKVTAACQKYVEIEGPEKGHEYMMGVDWAKHTDFTVLTVFDRTRSQVVAIDRFNQVDYAIQKPRLTTLAKKWGCTLVLAERNSIGEPLIEELEREDVPVRPFTTTNATKKEMIDALVLAFEREEIIIPPEPVLVNELQAFEMKKTPSGLLRYTAPDGYHDDCVISLGLAWRAALLGAPADVFDNPFL